MPAGDPVTRYEDCSYLLSPSSVSYFARLGTASMGHFTDEKTKARQSYCPRKQGEELGFKAEVAWWESSPPPHFSSPLHNPGKVRRLRTADSQPQPRYDPWEAVMSQAQREALGYARGGGLILRGFWDKGSEGPDVGCLLVSGEPLSQPRPHFRVPAAQSGLPRGPGSANLLPCSGIPVHPRSGCLGHSRPDWEESWGYLDLQMRWYLLVELLGKALCLGSCSLSPSGS